MNRVAICAAGGGILGGIFGVLAWSVGLNRAPLLLGALAGLIVFAVTQRWMLKDDR